MSTVEKLLFDSYTYFVSTVILYAYFNNTDCFVCFIGHSCFSHVSISGFLVFCFFINHVRQKSIYIRNDQGLSKNIQI